MDEPALVSAFILDRQGGGEDVTGSNADKLTAQDGLTWLHFFLEADETDDWFEEESGLDPLVVEALLADDTRPRTFSHGDGMLVILRGVNLNPGDDPEQMITVRVWLEPERIITVRRKRIMAADDLRQALRKGDGPSSPGEFIVDLADRLAERMADVLAELDDAVDELEDAILDAKSSSLRTELSNIRRQVIRMRRYLSPQREALTQMQSAKVSWLTDLDRMRIREVADHITRYVEDLDSARDRAAVAQDELENRLGTQMNKTMYMLSIVAAIFLPLGLLTGLLGINVGGIPGTENPYAFALVCIFLVFIAIIEWILFRRMRWV